eukprot:UN16456
MWSTAVKSARVHKYVALQRIKLFKKNMWYTFSDGSSTGWHACVILDAERTKVQFISKFVDCEGTRNVGSEAAAT